MLKNIYWIVEIREKRGSRNPQVVQFTGDEFRFRRLGSLGNWYAKDHSNERKRNADICISADSQPASTGARSRRQDRESRDLRAGAPSAALAQARSPPHPIPARHPLDRSARARAHARTLARIHGAGRRGRGRETVRFDLAWLGLLACRPKPATRAQNGLPNSTGRPA